MKNKTLLITLFALLPVSAYASDFTVIAYSNGDILYDVYNGIKMILGAGYIDSLIKTILIAGVIMGIGNFLVPLLDKSTTGYSFGAEGLLIFVKQAMLAAMAVYVLLIPKTNLIIEDRADPTQSHVVTGVPYVNAAVAGYASLVGDKAAEIIEDVFTPPDVPRFRTYGTVALGPKWMNNIFEIQAPGPLDKYDMPYYVPLRVVLAEYFEKCIFPTFAYDGDDPARRLAVDKGLSRLVRSPGVLFEDTFMGNGVFASDQPLTHYFDTPLTCKTAVAAINSVWGNALVRDKWIEEINGEFLGRNPNDPTGHTTVQQIFQRYFPGAEVNYKEGLQQIATLNTIKYALISWQSYYSSDVSSQATIISNKKTGAGWIEAGRLLNKIVYILFALMQAMIYLFSVFLPVAFVMGGLPVIGKWIRMVAFIHAWPMIYVLLNSFADHQFSSAVTSAVCAGEMNCTYPLNFETVDKIQTEANLVLGYIGAFAWIVPSLAWGLVKGGEHAITAAITPLASAFGGQSTAHSTGAEMGVGNMSVGNHSVGNQSFMSSRREASNMMGNAQHQQADYWKGLIDLNGGNVHRAMQDVTQTQLRQYQTSAGVMDERYREAGGNPQTMRGQSSEMEKLNLDKTFAQIGAEVKNLGQYNKYRSENDMPQTDRRGMLQDRAEAPQSHATPDGLVSIGAGGYGSKESYSPLSKEDAPFRFNPSSRKFDTISTGRKGAGFELGYSGGDTGQLAYGKVANMTAQSMADQSYSLERSANDEIGRSVARAKDFRNTIDWYRSKGFSKEDAEQITNRTGQGLERAIKEDTSFSHYKSNDRKDTLQGIISAGGKVLGVIGVEGNYRVDTSNAKGEKVSFSVSGSEAEKIAQLVERTNSGTLTESQQTGKRTSDTRTISKNLQNTRAERASNAARALQSMSEKQMMDMMPGFISHVAEAKFKDITDIKQRDDAAADYINRMAGSRNQYDRHDIFQKFANFVAQGGYDKQFVDSNLKDKVEQKITDKETRLGGQTPQFEPQKPAAQPGHPQGAKGQYPVKPKIEEQPMRNPYQMREDLRIPDPSFNGKVEEQKDKIKETNRKMGYTAGAAMVTRPERDGVSILKKKDGEKE